MAVNWNRRGYTKEQFIEAWNGSDSIAECARKLGLSIYGSQYISLKSAADELGLGREHMTGQAWMKNNFRAAGVIAQKNKKPLDEILVENSSYGRGSLKKRLIDEGLLESVCYAPYCPLSNPSTHPFTGEAVELKLSLDHINGINNDNRIENLRLLCYHCHGLTDTWCRGQASVMGSRHTSDTQNVGTRRKSECRFEADRSHACLDCDAVISSRAIRCKSCVGKRQKKKIDWPAIEVLLDEISRTSYTAVGKRLGVSDNAIRKHLKHYS